MKRTEEMRRSIDELIRKYRFSPSQIAYFAESKAENQLGNGFADWAELRNEDYWFIVKTDGTIH